MKKEEIYFLKKFGLTIQDEKEAITTDSIDKFPDISTYLEIMERITGEDLSSLYEPLKRSIYISCMMHYTVECYRKDLITQEIYNNALIKAENMFRSIGDEKIIALTLLYEGLYYLHPEILHTLEKAGYSKVVRAYCEIFEPLMRKVEKEKDFTVLYGKEKEAYMELYRNFMKMEDRKP